MKRNVKRLAVILLSLVMALGMMPGMGLPAYADFQRTKVWSKDITYKFNKTINEGAILTADVAVTIIEGKTLTVNGGIDTAGHTLTVFGPGALVVNGMNGSSDGFQGGAGSCGIKGNVVFIGTNVTVRGGRGGNGSEGYSGKGPGGDGGHGGPGGCGINGAATVKGSTVTITGGEGGNGGKGGDGGDYEYGPGRYYGGQSGNGGAGNTGVFGSVTVLGGSHVTVSGGKGGDASRHAVDWDASYPDMFFGHGGNGGIGIEGTIAVNDIEATVSGGNGGNGSEHSDPAVYDGSDGKALKGTITALSGASESDDNKTWRDISGSSSDKKFIRGKGVKHKHDFKYSVSGTTVTAICRNADGCCPLDNGGGKYMATVTLNATDAIYTGSAYTGASLAASWAWTREIQDLPTIVYEGRGSTSYPTSTTAPTDAGTYRAMIILDKDSTAEADFSIRPIALKIIGVAAQDRAYEKDNKAVKITSVRFEDENGKQVTLKQGEDYTATGTMADADAGEGKDAAVTVKLINPNYTLSKNTATARVNIRKAAARTIADVTDEQCYTLTSVSGSVAGTMPDDAGKLTYAAGKASTTGKVKVSDFTVSAKGAVSATLSGGKVGDTVTLPVIIGSTNYADSTANVVITLTDKSDAGVTVSGAPAKGVTYGDADFTLKAKVKDAGIGTGVWTWTSSDDAVLRITPNGATATVRILKAGPAWVTAKYESDTTVGSERTAVKVQKADPKIKTVPAGLTATYGQTLADVPLYNPKGNDPGTWTWMNDTTVVDDIGELVFKAKFTPDDSTNYRIVRNVGVLVTVGKASNPATVITPVYLRKHRTIRNSRAENSNGYRERQQSPTMGLRR